MSNQLVKGVSDGLSGCDFCSDRFCDYCSHY